MVGGGSFALQPHGKVIGAMNAGWGLILIGLVVIAVLAIVVGVIVGRGKR